MPDGVEPPSSPESHSPLDGVLPPNQSSATRLVQSDGRNDELDVEKSKDLGGQKRLLLIILSGFGAFLLFYLFFAFYLLASLPDPEGGGGVLKIFGNLLYGGVSILSLSAVILLGLRMLRSGQSPDELPKVLLRPGIVVLFIVGLSILVLIQINGSIALHVDILEPKNIQGLTAPVSVTFGSDSLRRILQNQGISPREYKWDFNGDGTIDAETQEHSVTTLYKKKGTYVIRVKILLSDSTVREAIARLVIPNAVFSLEPASPVLTKILHS